MKSEGSADAIFRLRGGNTEDDASRQRREASEQSLAQGGLPLNAIERLREQAGRQGTPGHIFTGDLSVHEMALVRQAGYEPLGQVMGSSVYYVGWQWLPNWSGSSGELEVLTQAYNNACHLGDRAAATGGPTAPRDRHGGCAAGAQAV